MKAITTVDDPGSCAMPAGMTLLPGVADRLFADPDAFLRSRLAGWSGWELVPLDRPARDRFIGLLVARFAALPFDSPLAAYGLGVRDAFESSELAGVVTRLRRDALIERVERGVLTEMVLAGVITYPISGQMAA